VIRTLGSYVLVPSFESFSEGEYYEEIWIARINDKWKMTWIEPDGLQIEIYIGMKKLDISISFC